MPTNNATYADELRATIDALALNLTNYGHTWSPELRSAYERAIALLERSQNWTLHGDPDGPFPASEPKATVKTKPGETTVTVDFRKRRGMSAECKKLRGPNDTGPDCGCRGDACALGRDAAKRQESRYLEAVTDAFEVELEVRQNELHLAMAEVEKMPASEEQTACIIRLGERMRKLVELRGKSEVGRSLPGA